MNAKSLQQLSREMKNIVKQFDREAERILKREASYFVAFAKKLTTKKKVVNLGYYRNSFAYDRTVKKNGRNYTIKVYNSADYAMYLEYGFRSHFVPGYWRGHAFVYDRNANGGMWVGGKKGSIVKGHFIMRDSEKNQKKTFEKRIGAELEKLFTRH